MDITHQPYDKFMQKNVLDPLSMTCSSCAQPLVERKHYYLPEIKKAVDADASILDKCTGKYSIDRKTAVIQKNDYGLSINVSANLL